MAHAARFCIVAQARTGTEYLATRLHGHPQVACHRELFNRDRVVSALDERAAARLPSVAERDADPVAALERIVEVSGEAFPKRPLFGFKLFLAHAPALRRHVREDERWALILLERRNKLAQYASFLTAKQTGRWNAFASDPPPATAHAVRIDLAAFERYVGIQENHYAEFARRLGERPRVLRVESERLAERFDEILAFLGAAPVAALPERRVRQNPQPLAERVSNWAEVTDWLAAHGHEDWAAG